MDDPGNSDDGKKHDDDYCCGRSQVLSNDSCRRLPIFGRCPDMCWGPRQVEGPNYMEEEVVTVGRAGRLSITPRQNVPWYEGKTTALHRMHADYRHLRVIP